VQAQKTSHTSLRRSEILMWKTLANRIDEPSRQLGRLIHEVVGKSNGATIECPAYATIKSDPTVIEKISHTSGANKLITPVVRQHFSGRTQPGLTSPKVQRQAEHNARFSIGGYLRKQKQHAGGASDFLDWEHLDPPGYYKSM
jgi:hypothetical protein